MTENLPSRLTPYQIAYFKTEGYLAFHQPVLSTEKFKRLKDTFEEILADLPDDFSPEMMDVPHYTFPQLYEFLFDEEVLGLVSPFLGEDIALFSSHFISKPGGKGKRVPWHEDSAYWKGWMEPMEVVTVWLAIDSSTVENGCLKVVPRTQDNGYSEYAPVDGKINVFDTEIIPSQRKANLAVSIELEPNHASLHDGKLIHGSDANTSPMRRCGYTMRYISTRTRFRSDLVGHFQKIFLAHGQDRAGNVYGDPDHIYIDLARTRTKHIKSGH